MNLRDLSYRITANDETSAGSQSARKNLTSIKSCVEEVGVSMLKMQSIVTTAFTVLAGTGAVGSFGKSILDAGLAMERLNTQFKVTTGSAVLAAGEYAFAREEANRLGAEVNGLAGQYAKLMFTTKGTALEGSGTRDMFTGMTEGFTAMKLSSDQMQSVWQQVTQGMNKGKLELEDLKIIAEAGIPVFKLLGGAIGKSQPEIMQMITDGKLLSGDVYPKLAASMHATFGVSAVEAANGAQGAMARFSNELTASKNKIATEWLPTFTSGLKAITDNLEAIKTGAMGVATAIAGIAFSRIVIPAAVGFAPYVSNAINPASGAVALEGVVADKMRAAAVLDVARAKQVETVAVLEEAAATKAAIIAAREDTVAQLAVTTSVQGRAIVTRELATLGMQQANVERALTVASLENAAAQTVVTGAVARYAAATKAATIGSRALAVAGTALGGVMSFFGGPIGLLITGLAIAGTAWSIYSGKQDQADKSSRAVLDSMEEQVRLIREKKRLESFKGPAEKNYNDEEQKKLKSLQDQIGITASKAESSIYESDSAAHQKALAALENFHSMKKEITESKAAEEKVSADLRATSAAALEKSRLEKLADDYRKLAQAQTKSVVELEKERGKLKLDILKDSLDIGLVTYDQYYSQARTITEKAMNLERAALQKQRDLLGTDLAAGLAKGNGKDDEKTIAIRTSIVGIDADISKLAMSLQTELSKIGESAGKALSDQIKDQVKGIKDLSDVFKDLGKEELSLAENRFSEELQRQIDLFGQGAEKITGMIAPLKKYRSAVEDIFSQRYDGQIESFNAFGEMYEDFAKKLDSNKALTKGARQGGLEILQSMKDTAVAAIGIETDKAKKILDSEKNRYDSMKKLIIDKEKEIREVRYSLAEQQKKEDEADKVAMENYSGIEHLDPNLDPLAKRQAMMEKLRRDEAAADSMSDPARKLAAFNTLYDEWGKLNSAVVLVGKSTRTVNDLSAASVFNQFLPDKTETIETLNTVVSLEEAIRVKKENQQRTHEKIKELLDDQKLKLEEEKNAAQQAMDEWAAKIRTLDGLLQKLNRDIVINLKVNGMEQIDKMADILNSTAMASVAPQTSGQKSNVTANDARTGQLNGVASDYFQKGDSFYWGDGTYAGPAYSRGTPYVPNTGLALVHKGERITPANQNLATANQIPESAVQQVAREVSPVQEMQAASQKVIRLVQPIQPPESAVQQVAREVSPVADMAPASQKVMRLVQPIQPPESAVQQPQQVSDGSWWLNHQQVVKDEKGSFHNALGYQAVLNNNLPALPWDYNSKSSRQQNMAGKDFSELQGMSQFQRLPLPAKPAAAAPAPTAANVTISIGDIIVQGGATGVETAREIARRIMPELEKIAGRKLAA